ncbi:c-type cytochrome [Rhodobacteraceae bacterium D3-12]|nr:c-type cytochrome [Rhodobacteraceae bacterium D3-12]
MSRFLKALSAVVIVGASVSAADADTLGLGRVALPEEVTAWDIDVRPDGMGLPEGRGNVADGEEIFAEKCAVCHGDFGEGVDRWPVLAGGQGTLSDMRPVKTIGSYWPYLSTVWDYVHRAMPFGEAQSLSNDEVYAITAYLLYVNDLVDDDFELSKANFAAQKLPNEAAFYMDDRAKVGGELASFNKPDVCMENCKPAVEITARAAVIDVTPDDAAARKAREEAAVKPEPAAEAPKVAPAVEPAAEPAAPKEAALDPEMVTAGKKVFKKCKACHQVGEGAKNRTGPILNGVMGSKFAQVEGFKYSKTIQAMAEDGMVWDEANMTEFLTKPRKFIKKTKMSFAGLKKDKEIEAVIAYLKSIEK